MNHFDPPAELPASLRDQLRALAPYMHNFKFKGNGGFVIELSVPREIITDFDETFLVQHGISLTVRIDAPELSCNGLIYREPRFVDFTLEYM